MNNLIEEVQRAKAIFGQAVKKLEDSGRAELASLLRRFIPWVLPYLADGRPKNPVHHTAHVVSFIVEILLGDGAGDQNLKRGIFTALLHDIGLARTSERKIRKDDLRVSLGQAQTPAEAQRLRDEAIASRQSHMTLGSESAGAMLQAFNVWEHAAFSDEDIIEIQRLVAIHDNPSIAEYGVVVARAPLLAGHVGPVAAETGKWLFEKSDTTIWALRQADRAWMLHSDGIETDLVRDREKAQEQAARTRRVFDPASVTPLGRIQSNLCRHYEEAELYRLAHGPNAAGFGFRAGFLYRTVTGHAIFRRLLRELELRYRVTEAAVAASLGGTKIAVALVDRTGVSVTTAPADWRTRFGVEDQPKDGQFADRLVGGIAREIENAVEKAKARGAFITRIGLATKGPLQVVAGEVVIGPCSTLPFQYYPIERRLREALAELGVRLPLEILHDGAAAALGEAKWASHQTGQPRLSDLTAVIIGTGIGLGVIQDGQVFEGIGPQDTSTDDWVRNFGSLGRHLVCVAPDGSRYEYRGAPPGTDRPPLDEAKDELYFTERIAGPWLAVRVAGRLLAESAEPRSSVRETIASMGLQEAELRAISTAQPYKRADLNRTVASAPADLRTKVLVGLTQSARKGDKLAKKLIAEIGVEIGVALGAFITRFRPHRFVRRLVLVSTVAEKLGRGVLNADGQDLLLSGVHQSVRQMLAHNGIDGPEADILAQGIIRSDIDYQREFWAFCPTNL